MAPSHRQTRASRPWRSTSLTRIESASAGSDVVQSGAPETACRQCGASVSVEAAFCNTCGNRLQERCLSCQASNPLGSAYCRECGVSLSGSSSDERRREVSSGPLGWKRAEHRERPAPISTECPRCHSVNEVGALFCFSCGLPLTDAQSQGAQFTQGVLFASGLKPVGFWARLFAWIVDALVIGVISAIIQAIVSGGGPVEAIASASTGWGALVGLVYYAVGVSVWSTTIGKRMINAYVLRPDGSKVGLLRAVGRWLAYIPSTLLLLGGFIIAAFRDDKRALHDLICDTVVVYRHN